MAAQGALGCLSEALRALQSVERSYSSLNGRGNNCPHLFQIHRQVFQQPTWVCQPACPSMGARIGVEINGLAFRCNCPKLSKRGEDHCNSTVTAFLPTVSYLVTCFWFPSSMSSFSCSWKHLNFLESLSPVLLCPLLAPYGHSDASVSTLWDASFPLCSHSPGSDIQPCYSD